MIVPQRPSCRALVSRQRRQGRDIIAYLHRGIVAESAPALFERLTPATATHPFLHFEAIVWKGSFGPKGTAMR